MVERDRNMEDVASNIVSSRAPNINSDITWAAGEFPAAAESMRRIAAEVAAMSLASLDQAKRLIEDVRDAHDMDDLMAIQTKYMTALFESFAERSRRIGSLLAELPQEATQASLDMVEASVEAAQETAEIAAKGLAAAATASQEASHDAG